MMGAELTSGPEKQKVISHGVFLMLLMSKRLKCNGDVSPAGGGPRGNTSETSELIRDTAAPRRKDRYKKKSFELGKIDQ